MIVLILNRLKYFVFSVLILLFSCIYKDSSLIKTVVEPRDLAQILASGKIIAVTDFTSTNYFIYKGEPMGYQYEMLSSLAEELGVKLELIAENNPDKALEMLKSGEVDIITNNLTELNSKKFQITEPYLRTHQVLVQRKNFTKDGVDSDHLIQDQIFLANKNVYVKENSEAAIVLKKLFKEDKIPMEIHENSVDEAEDLIDLVSSGKIDYAVCDENIAKIEAALYSNIDVETMIGNSQNLTWVLSKKSSDLLNKVNQWIHTFSKSITHKNIYDRYFDNPYMAIIKQSDYFYSKKGKLSVYDDQIKQESTELNWDWRLLASLIYQESKFNPTVKSESGAYGLMQFMPITSEYFGIDRKAGPSIQLKTGVRYLKMLEKYMVDIRIPEKERLKFVLAAYNAGFGHILDARNLARKYGKDPNVWDNNVGFFIQNKTDFYNDTVVRYGYLRGSETYRYVSQILDRYDHYKNIIRQ
jgi:membrane-bound lytic murein transglycosylase F